MTRVPWQHLNSKKQKCFLTLEKQYTDLNRQTNRVKCAFKKDQINPFLNHENCERQEEYMICV
jgi:hypothetical protein